MVVELEEAVQQQQQQEDEDEDDYFWVQLLDG